MHRLGVPLIFAVILNTLVLWVFSKADPSIIAASPLRSFGQALGLLASVLVSIDLLLSSRARFLEPLFGSLDRVYRKHAFLGALSFLFMLNHPLLLAVSVLPAKEPALRYFLPAGDWSYTFGILALYGIILLLMLTLFIKLPYQWWKATHTLLIVPQVLIMLHVLLIQSDTSRYLPLKLWVLGWGSVGLLAYAYRKLWYPRSRAIHRFLVDAVNQIGGVTELVLKPATPADAFDFAPGQFAYLSVRDVAVGTEEHPFTISSRPGEPFIRFSVKMTGDYTRRLPLITPGTEVLVAGPYGMFGLRSMTRPLDDIWIAGGIGLTPFLSMLGNYPKSGIRKKIWLFYSTAREADAVYNEEIRSVAAANPDITFVHLVGARGERITAETVRRQVGSLEDKQVFLCGPPPMIEDLWYQFLKAGVRPSRLITEEFNFSK